MQGSRQVINEMIRHNGRSFLANLLFFLLQSLENIVNNTEDNSLAIILNCYLLDEVEFFYSVF